MYVNFFNPLVLFNKIGFIIGTTILFLSLIFIALWFVALNFIDKKIKKTAGFTPVITAVIIKEEKN